MSFLNMLDEVADESYNGLCLNNTYVPGIMLHILTYVEPKEILKYSLVCRQWNKLIKSDSLWSTLYKRKYNRRAKKLPWYLYYCLLSTNYFDTNLLRNGNGQDGFEHWEITQNGGDKWTVENPPLGVNPLPLNVPEFSNKTSCFATSYRYILNNYKPHIYLSEWIVGSTDCEYILKCGFVETNEPVNVCKAHAMHILGPWRVSTWEKTEITVTEYPEGIKGIIFEHLGFARRNLAGHYGSKMAGGVVKLLFDTIESLPTDDEGNEIPKKFSKLQFVVDGQNHVEAPRESPVIMYHDYFAAEVDDDEVPILYIL